MKEFLLGATYIVGVGELFLAWYFWKTNSGNEIRKVMGLLSFSIGAWAIFNGFSSYVASSSFVSMSLNMLFIAGIFALFSLLHLSIIFPYKTNTFDSLHIFLLYFPAFIWSMVLLTTKTVIKSYEININIPGHVTPGPLFGHFYLTVVIAYLVSTIIVFLKLKRSGGIHKRLLRLFFWSVLLGGLPAMVFGIAAAFFSVQWNPLIPVITSGIWAGITSYIIFSKK